MTPPVPEPTVFLGTCDMCSAHVPVARFRIEQVKTDDYRSMSRNVLLCVSCRAPIVAILKSVAEKQHRRPLERTDIDQLESPALRAQRATHA